MIMKNAKQRLKSQLEAHIGATVYGYAFHTHQNPEKAELDVRKALLSIIDDMTPKQKKGWWRK